MIQEMHMKSPNASVLLLVSLLAGCASQSALESTRYEVDSINTRLFSINRDLSALRDESKVSAGSIEKEMKGDIASLRKLSADIQANLDSTKSDIQQLSGKFDDTVLSVKKPSEDLARYREDADKRIIALEERILKQQGQLETLAKKVTELAKIKREDPPPPPPADAPYLKGLDLLKVGEVSAARDQFTRFLEQNPKHELAANAHYWIGETYYTEKNFESAILSYQEVIKSFPGKDKVVAAMLKQAMAFSEIKDPKSAKFVLKKLIEGFPKSEEARKAKDLLKDMK